MTHEIRTPINAIVGFSEVLSALTTAEEKKEIIQIIKNNCDMLLRLINDILTASSLESGHMDIKPVEVDFAKAFNELFESLKPRVQEPGVEFIKDNPYDTLPIKVDVDRVSQVFTNFMTNAVKYTHQGHIPEPWMVSSVKACMPIVRIPVRASRKRLSPRSSSVSTRLTILCRAPVSASPSAKPSPTPVMVTLV